MRAIAPGGGASVTRCTMPTAWPASPSSSASRGAWSLARTSRAFSPTQCSTPSTSRSVRPGGSTGSRQPNWSPLVRLFEANAMPSATPASDCQVSSSVLRAVEVALPVARREVGGRPVLGQVARLDHLRVPLVGLAPEEVGRRRRGRRARRGRGGSTGRGGRGRSCGATRRAQTSAASPAWRARPSAALAPVAASPPKRARSWARRSGRRDAPSGRGAPRISPAPPAGSRNSVAGRRATSRTGSTLRWSVGSKARRESISSPNSSIRTGRGADGGKTSTMPPRRANSPRPATSMTGE